MNLEETKKILTVIQTAYPTYKVERMEDTLKLWTMMLKDFTYKQVSLSLQVYIYNNKFPPTISDIAKGISENETQDTENFEKAWVKVLNACKHTYTESYWEKLPERIKKCTSVQSLREWALMDSQVVNTVVKSNWIKAYQQVIEREKKYDALPSPVLKALGIETKKMQIEHRGENNGRN